MLVCFKPQILILDALCCGKQCFSSFSQFNFISCFK